MRARSWTSGTESARDEGNGSEIEESAATVATWFTRVIIYEDRDLRGRKAGEMTRLISGALARHRPDILIRSAAGLEDAVRSALELASPADPVLLTYEELDPVRDLLDRLGATVRAGRTSPDRPL